MNPNLCSNILSQYGKKGEIWLADLPNLILQVQDRYGLSSLIPAHNMSYNHVLLGLHNAQPIVLKLGLDVDGFKREAAALRAFSGFGAVKLLAEENGLLLLERANPGVSLKSYCFKKEEESLVITTHIIKHLQQAPVPQQSIFPHLKDWLKVLDASWNIPEKHLQKARGLRDALLHTANHEILLHGDLHHDNILKNHHDWVVIDPKGVMGDPIYEVVSFIRNPMPELLHHSEHIDIIHQRIKFFADSLQCLEQRISQWCFVQAVLSWIWALEDNAADSEYFAMLTNCFWKINI